MGEWKRDEYNGMTVMVYTNDEPDPEPLRCIECGKILPPQKKRYCSDLCAWKHGQSLTYHKPKPKPKKKKCPVCGKDVEKGRFCSEDCEEFWNKMIKLSQSEKDPSAHEVFKDRSKRSATSEVDDIAQKAQEAGMSYGEYVARYDK